MSRGSSPSSPRKLQFILKSRDGKEVEISEEAALQSTTLSDMISNLEITSPDDPRLREPIPVANVDGWTLEKIVQWCEIHKGEAFRPKEESEDPRTQLTAADEEYLKVDLANILLGANYLNIPSLIDVVTQKIANLASGKTVQELRDFFGLPNDFTKEEEADLKRRFPLEEV